MEKNNKRSRKKSPQTHTAPPRKKTSNFVVQGTILAVAGILVRLIGMFYRIPLNRILGKEGMGYYSSAYSVYSIMLIVSSYSLPVAVSKMVATRLAKKEYRSSIRILKASLFYATIAGGIAAALLWFGADFFAKAMEMEYSAYALKTLAPTIWIMAYLGVLRGYFQGIGSMIPTAVSQVFEQIVNAIVSVAAASYLFGQGLLTNLVYDSQSYSYGFGAAGGAIGTGAGAFIALLFVLFIFFSYRPTMKRQVRRDRNTRLETYGEISYIMCITILPVIISSAIYNVTTVVDNFIFGNAMSFLQREGEIASSWGVYMGQYHLLFNIPVAIANSLSSSLIPSLSRAVASRSKAQVISKVNTVIRFSMIVAIPSTIGLTVLAGPISNLLFAGEDNAMLVRMTVIGSVAVVFFSLSTVTNAVLQGINRMKTPIYNAAISLVIHVIVLTLMMYVFKLGIYSVVYSNILFALTVCLLNAWSMKRYLRYRQEKLKTFVLPAIAAAFMGAACYGVYRLVFTSLDALVAGAEKISIGPISIGSYQFCNLFGTLLAILAAVIVYGVLLIKIKCINAQELSGMPGGTKVVRLAKRFHLL